MDISLAGHAQFVLEKELHAAFERWIELCEITAREEGVAQEDLLQELSWLRGRRDRLLKHSTPHRMRQVLADICNAEAWVHSGLRSPMRGLEASSDMLDTSGAASVLKPAVNHFKHALQAGQVQIGLRSTLPYASELLASAGFDWLLHDAALALVPARLKQQEPVAAETPGQGRGRSHNVVRPAWSDAQGIQRCLGMGAKTLLLPSVHSADAACAAVQTVRQALENMSVMDCGVQAEHGDGICLLVQVEAREALKEVDAIAQVDGVDGVFIGPADLPLGLGGCGHDGMSDGMRAEIEQALASVRACGKAPGILAAAPDCVQASLDAGALFVAVGTDRQLLRQGGDALAARFKPQAMLAVRAPAY